MSKGRFGYSILVLALALVAGKATAQQGFGTATPSKASAIEMLSDTKGLLIPRVALTSLTSFAPILGELGTSIIKTNSLLVYNTTTDVAANLLPGYYYWTTNGATGRWNRLVTSTDITHTVAIANNVLTSVVNSVSATANVIHSNTLTLDGSNNLVSTVNNQASTALNLSPAVNAHETLTSLTQNNTTGIITYAPERGTSVTANLRSTAAGNLITYNGGVFLDATAVQNNQHKTVVSGTTPTVTVTPTTGANTTTYQVSVATANNTGTLGLVKQATTNPSVNVAADGTLSVNVSGTGGIGKTLTGSGITVTAGSTAGIGSSLTNTVLADVALGIADNAITTIKIADNAVTTVKILDKNVTPAKLSVGTANQILVTNVGASSAIWQDPSTVVQEPWRIQASANPATTNVQNIYQEGRVAIGDAFTTTLSGQALKASLYVKGKTASTSTVVNPAVYVDGDVEISGNYYTVNSKYADYVFEKYYTGKSKINSDYSFTPLHEVKQFIAKNHHLPGVTPISEVEKTNLGYKVDLTTLSMQQLEKVEELYLHLIEQQEQIDAKNKEIELLKMKQSSLEERLLKLEKLLEQK